VLAAERAAQQVGLERRHEDLRVDVDRDRVPGKVGDRGAGGVVVECVEPAELRPGGIDGPLPVGLRGDVGAHPVGLAAGGDDRVDRGLEPLLGDVAEHHGGALGGELVRGGEPDPRGGAGHDRDPCPPAFPFRRPSAGR